MTEYFPEVKSPISYEGSDSKNPFAFKHYNPDEVILGKSMKDHFRFSVCYWHTFKGLGSDPFGPGHNDPGVQRFQRSNENRGNDVGRRV